MIWKQWHNATPRKVMKCAINVLVKHEAFKLLYKHLQKKKHFNIKRGDLQITPLFWFVDRVPKKLSDFWVQKKPRLENTKWWGHKKSPGRFGGSEGVVPHCNLVGFVESVGWNPFQTADGFKSRSEMEKKDEPVFFASCSCYFLFMSFHLKNWADDIEAREWSIATAIESLTSNISRRFPSFGGFGRLPRGTCHTGSLGLDRFITSSFASGCVMPLLPGCQRGWKVGPGRPHPFPSVRTVHWKFLPSSVCNCFG